MSASNARLTLLLILFIFLHILCHGQDIAEVYNKKADKNGTKKTMSSMPDAFTAPSPPPSIDDGVTDAPSPSPAPTSMPPTALPTSPKDDEDDNVETESPIPPTLPPSVESPSPAPVAETLDPTGAPKSPSLTTMPTAPSTLDPTTAMPNVAPTTDPTAAPSAKATKIPTTKAPMAPTKAPTATTMAPKTPTKAPDSASMAAPNPPPTPPGDATVSVSMPKLSFLLQRTDGLTNDDNDDIEESLQGFLSDFLRTGTYAAGFRYLELETVSSGDVVRTVAIVEDSAAHYKSNSQIPTETELATIFTTYFSFWGDRNLGEYLSSNGFPATNVTQVLLDGTILESQGNPDPDATAPNGIDNDAETPSSAENLSGDSDSFDRYIIIGIIVGGCVLLLAIALLVRTTRKMRSNASEPVLIDSLDDDDDLENVIPNAKSSVASKVTKDVVGDADRMGAVPHEPRDVDTSSDAGEVLSRASNTPLKYPGMKQQTPSLHIQSTGNDNDDDDDDDDTNDGAYVSDGDIISVTESLMMRSEYSGQGPLFNVKTLPVTTKSNEKNITTTDQATGAEGVTAAVGAASGGTANPVDAARNVAASGKSSVRAPQNTSFQYDASRLDKVISNAKNNSQ